MTIPAILKSTAALLLAGMLALPLLAQRQMENLNRGVVAIHQPDGKVFISWRLLGTDHEATAFNVYRLGAGGGGRGGRGGQAAAPAPVKINPYPLVHGTWFVDTNANLAQQTSYTVRAVVNGIEQEPSAPFVIQAGAPPLPYLSIPLQLPEGYSANDISTGDLDGDGAYDLVLKSEVRPRDNAHAGLTDATLLQGYKLDGTLLWTINLGKNIREGAHYTQFMVYDFDGNGHAEIIAKTADGTMDGQGRVIGDPEASWASPAGATISWTRRGEAVQSSTEGHILKGPEYLTVFDGRTGGALATVDYVPGRHPDTHSPTPEQLFETWGDPVGNRSDRYLAAVAYLDGSRPSVVMARGYYTRTVLAAWDWRDGKLTQRWIFNSQDGTEGNLAYRGQGNHGISVADVDGDGRDEIIYGASVIDDNGRGLYSTGRGHGDAQHTSDLDPSRPGLETYSIHENPRHEHGINLRDARTGEMYWSKPSPDIGRGLAADIDPRHPGAEYWATGDGLDSVWNSKGEMVSVRKPRSVNFAIWWDGDPLREILNSNTISKWDWHTSIDVPLLVAHGTTSNNGTKSTPALSADLFGDWREEVIWRTTDNRELRIYTTTIPTDIRMPTLMHDAQYRLAIAWQNVAYNQPPHPSFFIGHGMQTPPWPRITTPARQ